MAIKIGTDGAVVFTESPLVQGWDNVTSFDTLLAHADQPLPDNVKGGLSWIGSKLPAALLRQVLGTIHEFPNKETGFVLLYRISDSSWRVHCPNQSGSGASVAFADDRADGAMDGYAEVGTIHTHPEMSAFWSGTDLADQKGKRGVHIVFGLHGGLVAQSLCTIFSAESHYDVPLWDVCEEVPLDEVFPPVEEWVETIAKQAYKPPITAAPVKSWGVGWDYSDSDYLGGCGMYDYGRYAGVGKAARKYRTEGKPQPARQVPVYSDPLDAANGVICEQAVRDMLAALLEADPEYACQLFREVAENAGMYDVVALCAGSDKETFMGALDPIMEAITAEAEDNSTTLSDLDDLMADFGYARNLDPTSVLDAIELLGSRKGARK